MKIADRMWFLVAVSFLLFVLGACGLAWSLSRVLPEVRGEAISFIRDATQAAKTPPASKP